MEVARHARIGSPVGSLVFPAALTRVPKDWQVATASFTAQHGLLVANSIQVTAGPTVMAPETRSPANVPLLSVSLVSEEKATNAYCHGYDSFPGDRHPRGEVINGYRVLAGPVRGPYPPLYQLCAPDADGLIVFVWQVGAHPKLNVTAIFSRLHLLGTDPANWTTRPVG